MATIVGGVGSTHVPAIGKAIAEKKQNDPYWKPFFKGFDYVHYWLARTRPDVAVVFYNDHGLNFFLYKLPTFAVGATNEYRSEDEGWGIPVSRPIPGDAALSWHLINALVADEFVLLTRSSSGSQIYMGVVPAGSSIGWTEKQAVSVRLGNPGGVVLTVNGKRQNSDSTTPLTLSFSPGTTTQSPG